LLKKNYSNKSEFERSSSFGAPKSEYLNVRKVHISDVESPKFYQKDKILFLDLEDHNFFGSGNNTIHLDSNTDEYFTMFSNYGVWFLKIKMNEIYYNPKVDDNYINIKSPFSIKEFGKVCVIENLKNLKNCNKNLPPSNKNLAVSPKKELISADKNLTKKLC
jgi:hypothetical protein